MSSICKNPRLMVMSVILLFSLILAWSAPFTYQTPTYSRSDRERVVLLQQQAILTTDNPILFLNLTYSTFRVDIVGLETNDTPVSIRAINPGEFLDIQNVIFIDEIPLTIFSGSDDWDVWDEWDIIIVREDNDVNVSIEAEVWYYAQGIFEVAPPINLSLYGIPFTFIALFWFGNLERQCRVHKTGEKNWDRKQGPIVIIVLMLIASFFLMPLLSSLAQADFIYEGNRQRTYNVGLLEYSPTRSFFLREILEHPLSEVSIRTNDQDVQFIVEDSDGSEDTISWVIADSYGWSGEGWWLLFEEDTSYETLTLSRVSANVTARIEVAYSVTQFYLPYRIDYLVGFAVIGFLPLGLALVKAYRIDQLFRKPEDTEQDDNNDIESDEDNIVN